MIIKKNFHFILIINDEVLRSFFNFLKLIQHNLNNILFININFLMVYLQKQLSTYLLKF